MKKLVFIALLFVFSAPAWADEAAKLTVTGVGLATGVPDLATLNLGVTERRTTAGEALDATSSATSAVLQALVDAGIAEKDIQTSQLTLNPQWNYRASGGQEVNEIVGYVASNMLTVRIRDITKVGSVLDQVSQNGANEFRGLIFGFAEPQSKEDDARSAAVKDAIRKAGVMAAAAGVELGSILSINEQIAGGGPVMMAEARMAADNSVPVAAGEVSLRANVQVVFALQD